MGVSGSTWSQQELQKQIKLPTFCMAVLDSFSAPERTDRDWPVAFAGTNAGQAPTAVASHRRWCMNWSWWHPDKSSRFKPTCFCLNRLETRTSQNYQQAIWYKIRMLRSYSTINPMPSRGWEFCKGSFQLAESTAPILLSRECKNTKVAMKLTTKSLFILH